MRSKANSPPNQDADGTTYRRHMPNGGLQTRKKPERATEMGHHLDQGRHGSRPC